MKLPSYCIELGVLIALVVLSLNFVGAGADDASIMLFAGESLGNNHWFLNHNNVPQEISTSVLGACLAGIAAFIAPSGLEYVIWKILAWVPAIFTGLLIFNLLKKYCGLKYALFAILGLCAFPQWHYWAWGGMESGLFWLCTTLFLVWLAKFSIEPNRQSKILVFTLASILPLVREDALWAPLLLLIVGYSHSIPFLQRILPGLSSIFVVFIFHCIRFYFTHQWFPNPVYAKAPFSIDSLLYGVDYIFQFHSDSPLHVLLSISLPISIFSYFYTKSIERSFKTSFFKLACVFLLIIDLTTVMVGGDWMGHHRFAVRGLPFKIIVITMWFEMMASSGFFLEISLAVKKLFVVFLLLIMFSGWSADGVVERPGFYKSFPAINIEINDDWNSVFQYMTYSNVPFLRDTKALLPWINDELPKLISEAKVNSNVPLVVASYQAGFFPRELRLRYSVEELFFIDLAGLSDSRIGRLAGDKSPLGLSDGIFSWARTIANANGALGVLLKSCRPDVVYVLSASPVEIDLMKEAGFLVAYTKYIEINKTLHGAIIFKSTRIGEKSCIGLR